MVEYKMAYDYREASNIGKRIKLIRKLKNMTIKDLSDKSDLSMSYISRLENNERGHNIRVLEKLAIALDVSVKSFISQDM